MAQIVQGMVVCSKAGRDAGAFMLVLEMPEKGFAFIADGMRHKIGNPKRKRLRHLAPTRKVIKIDTICTDEQLKQLLTNYNGPLSREYGTGGNELVKE